MKKTKKFISLFITICLLMTFVPMQMAYPDSAFSGGNGTMDDPYLITSANDFKQLATEVNGGNNYSNTYFKIPETVTETIELSTDDGYVPIGNDTNQFEGTFDGGWRRKPYNKP